MAHVAGLVAGGVYPSPFPEFPVLQWSYPYCWPPLMISTILGLEKYGYGDDAARVGPESGGSAG